MSVLSSEPDAHPGPLTPSAWLGAVFRHLAHAVANPEDPLRTPALVTVGADGAPAARHVVLREVVAVNAKLTVWTDARSPKCREIAAQPRVAWLFWDPGRRLQLRLCGRAEVLTEGARVQGTWAGISSTRRREYLANVAPGALLAAAEGDRPAAPAFAMIDSWLDAADLLQLDRRGHRRARLQRAPDGGWQGDWVEP
ncbi:MAG: pyridoxamine 5'-phosphate oxidase family protein [Xanthomonadales bacterium]|jgi:hypothetical protein|nr:pyridoxamine 5'-phosphate oxidase family protein [Xanthomonadales bacterium]